MCLPKSTDSASIILAPLVSASKASSDNVTEASESTSFALGKGGLQSVADSIGKICDPSLFTPDK
ncbi:hypothetical protein BFJ63_vAg18057 [Fusarium oxysporum f. sp. narcissi]|uniref:Uncharacterized protein n=1 Tax=Fusarium oxysporum f. sp. narcissi TaxID=451672 RepID=A0A4Q2UZ92_FUSOX|nr:hypothetical protein BFJ63_vAg18057 [Fusarium oxysporum f. sp. narcissi]